VKDTIVKELMVPLSEYAVVNKNATLYQALIELISGIDRIGKIPEGVQALALSTSGDPGVR
jgi:hypothetical protein